MLVALHHLRDQRETGWPVACYVGRKRSVGVRSDAWSWERVISLCSLPGGYGESGCLENSSAETAGGTAFYL